MEETYKKSKGSGGQKGLQFQLDLLTVCLLNALRNHKNWKISSENPMAGKYDDIVIELDLETAVLVQAKYKENRKITKDQLFSDNSKNADFSLPKYFFSYEEIKRKFRARTVIICTNTAINTKGLEGILTLRRAQPSSVLYHESDCSFYSFNESILPDLKNSAEAYLGNNSRDKGVDKSVITEENLKDFLENLQIFSCYPCEDYLHAIIELLLSSLSCSSLCHNTSSQEILRKVEDWFQQPKGEYLTEARAKAMLCEIRSDRYCGSLRDFNVSFDRNYLDISTSEGIILVKAKEGYLLQMLKIYGALQDHKSKKLYVNPDDDIEVQMHIVEAFSLRRYKSLVMAWAAIEDKTAKEEMMITIGRILARDKYKQVILIDNSDVEFAQQFGPENICQIDGSTTFQDLSKDSQGRLLKTKNVLFQGHKITLAELLHTQTTADYAESLDSVMLEDLVRGKQVKVGVPLLDLEEDTARYYVNRRFQTRTDERDIQIVINERNLYDVQENMIVISDSAGMGKSTVLTKMAVTIKKANPSLWVIKINLDDYTRIFRDFVKINSNRIRAIDLLNSLEATKITNDFEKLVFSMSGKVVLMLDGVDEISPDYTDLVLSLLRNCQKSPNFSKIFVTTRPHVNLKLKEVGLFIMLPFSRQEQLHFLINYWMYNLNITNENRDKCKQYAKMLIRKVISWTKSSHYWHISFAEIPLQVRMLAEIFLKGQESRDWEGCKEYLERDGAEVKLPEKFNIAKLYDTFIEKKRHVFIDKGTPSGSVTATTALLNQFESCLAYHRSLAVNTILPEYQQVFNTQISEDNDTEEYIFKIGIVQRLGHRVHFIHRTFAEYFVANYIVQELKLQNPDVGFQRLLIDRILRNTGFKIVRDFIDTLLTRVSLPPNIFKQYRSLKSKENNSRLIFQLAEGGYVAILQLMLESVHFKIIEGRSVNVTDWRLRLPFRKRNTLNDLAVLVRQAGVNIKRGDGDTPLHLAVKEGHLDMVDFLVKQGADVNMKNDRGHTALHLATHWTSYDTVKSGNNQKNWNLVKYLVTHGADINSKDNFGFTPLHHVVKLKTLKNWDFIKYFVEHGADANVRDGWGEPVLHIAISHGAFDTVTCLVEHGADINMKNSENSTSLHLATYQKNWNLVKYLVKHGADVNERDHLGFTALYHVVNLETLNWSIIKYLVKHGADPNVKDHKGFTVLHHAVRVGALNIVVCLLDHGADVNMKSNQNDTALHIATYNENWNIVKYLVEHGADINAGGDEGLTVLHVAAKSNKMDIAEYLLEHGADVNAKNDAGLTVMHVAVELNNIDIIEYLLEHGADINIKNSEDNTALQMAMYHANWNIVKHLLEYGAKDQEGLTTLHIAVKLNELHFVEFLLDHGADIDVKSSEHNTALHTSFYHENWAIFKYLVEHGADVNAEDEEGLASLHMAAKFDEIEIIKYLLEHGADINRKNSNNDTALHMAIYSENWNIVKYLVEQGADVNDWNDKGLTALHLAVQFNEMEIVKCLLEHGGDINMKNSEDNTVLHMATYGENWNFVKYFIEHRTFVNSGDDEDLTAKFIDIDVVEYLLEHGADINIRNGRNDTALHTATYNENWNIVKYLVEHGADINAEGDEGLTVLHMVAKFDEIEIVKYLLEHGADINLRDSKNDTALHMAAYNENWNIFKYLVEQGADINAEGNEGLTALHVASNFNEIEIVRYLLEHGADINRKNGNNDTALHVAIYSKNWNIVEYLVEQGAEINDANDKGLTALHMTVQLNEMDIVDYLLEHGADINMKNSEHNTALHMAVYKEEYDTVRYLVEHGANINADDDTGITALHVATYNGDWNIFKYLVEHGADVNAGDDEGFTALHVVAKLNHLDIVEYLLKRGADAKIRNNENDTALLVAASKQNWKVVKHLVENGADVNAQNDAGITALHLAVKWNKMSIVEYLMDHGAYINLIDGDNQI